MIEIAKSLSDYMSNHTNYNEPLLYNKSNKEYQSLPSDTKVISSIIESMIQPFVLDFAKTNNLCIECPKTQNTYPDNVLSDGDEKCAVDYKSTYRCGKGKINGMTLGSYTGYFRNRKSLKNTMYPYEQYKENIIVCVIYDRSEKYSELSCVSLNPDLIELIIKNITIYVRPKWKIAAKSAGSGNTKNIGSIKSEKDIVNGNSIFSSEIEFDNYWMNY